MKNIYAMLSQVDFLDEIRKNERKAAAERLQKDICAFVAHYGKASTDECSYVLLRDGNILIRKDDEDEGEEVGAENLSLEEMEFLRKFMVERINLDLQYQEDEIDRYTNLCL